MSLLENQPSKRNEESSIYHILKMESLSSAVKPTDNFIYKQ